MNINEKLLDIQLRLKAPKSQYNSFGKYNYRNCEDILEAVKPLLSEHKLTLRLSDEIMLIGNRYYVQATAILSDGDSTITTTASAREDETKKGMDASQITGSCSSYARKYALNGMFAIDDNKDSDFTNKGDVKNNTTSQTQSKPQGKSKNATITAETMNKVNMALTKYKQASGMDTKTLLAFIAQTMKVTVDKKMTEQQAEQVIKQLAVWEQDLKRKEA